MSSPWRAALLLCLVWLAGSAPVCLAAEPQAPANGPQILEQFDRQQPQRRGGPTVLAEHDKQVVMFSIGAGLLLLLLGTASVGIAVAVYGKPLFLVHMLLAGLTVTVALIHVIVGMVWFFPF